jgi:anti-sigma regulatory factor (Ser/Thr protein kinase)
MNQLATIDLAPARHAPRLARTFAAETLARWSIGVEDVETVRLVVSELVTNAVRHAPTSQRISLELSCHDDVLRVTVSDDSAAPPERGELTSSTAEDGRGVELVDALADRWGSEPRRGGKVIWCELRASPRVEV